MTMNIFHKIGWFIGLVLLQVLILNNVHIAGYATPFIYVYLILKLDISTSRNGLLMWGFFLGLAVDIFSDTPGINTAATVFLAFIRTPYLRLFIPRDNQDTIAPSIRSMGFFSFLKYLMGTILTHHIIVFGLSFYSLADIQTLLIKIVSSTILSIACILAIDSVKK
ncbi:rod shape-determining protein MreD [Bacteroides sp. 519]|uniref:rod shape-determining protein MreD n=1 Tax=Bacteroides sp. 519 TaxID=2302937 RepID=UPI0013D8466E|nr:rod shape-determining protein MreD [Bacteroides sp. 519]NDV59925.1 rod shape-determining protein MreD [Bacteroides sp. 519]